MGSNDSDLGRGLWWALLASICYGHSRRAHHRRALVMGVSDRRSSQMMPLVLVGTDLGQVSVTGVSDIDGCDGHLKWGLWWALVLVFFDEHEAFVTGFWDGSLWGVSETVRKLIETVMMDKWLLSSFHRKYLIFLTESPLVRKINNDRAFNNWWCVVWTFVEHCEPQPFSMLVSYSCASLHAQRRNWDFLVIVHKIWMITQQRFLRS